MEESIKLVNWHSVTSSINARGNYQGCYNHKTSPEKIKRAYSMGAYDMELWHYIPSSLSPELIRAVSFSLDILKSGPTRYVGDPFFIDLGCGIGDIMRTISSMFRLYYLGVEIDERLINRSEVKEYIVHADLLKDGLVEKVRSEISSRSTLTDPLNVDKIFYFYTPVKTNGLSKKFFENIKGLQDDHSIFVFNACGAMENIFLEMEENGKVAVHATYGGYIYVFNFK